MKRTLICLAAMACMGNADPAPEQHDKSEFVGVYDGSSFESYMAMQVSQDGTFEWVLSVGVLDMRSKGAWHESDGTIFFATHPTPVPPEFRFLRFEYDGSRASEIPEVRIAGPRGQPFTNAETTIECANGNVVYGFAAGSNAKLGGYIAEPCDVPVAVTVVQGNYNVTSPRYDLPALGWRPGQALHLEFIPNDIGVYDLTGMQGTLNDGVLVTEGPLGTMDFLKVAVEQ